MMYLKCTIKGRNPVYMKESLEKIIDKNNNELKLIIKEIFSVVSLLTEDKLIKDRINLNIKKINN